MNKKLINIFVLFTVFLFLAACGNSNEETNTTVSTNETGETDSVPENAVRLTISINDGEQFINEQQVEIEESANLLEVLDETFYIETDGEDVITSIERVQASEEEGTSWHLFVNDELSDVPAKDYTLNGGDRITLDLQ